MDSPICARRGTGDAGRVRVLAGGRDVARRTHRSVLQLVLQPCSLQQRMHGDIYYFAGNAQVFLRERHVICPCCAEQAPQHLQTLHTSLASCHRIIQGRHPVRSLKLSYFILGFYGVLPRLNPSALPLHHLGAARRGAAISAATCVSLGSRRDCQPGAKNVPSQSAQLLH